MTNNLLNRIDLDDVLAKFSICGRYHVITGLCLTLGLAFNTMCYSNYVFIADEIKYSCSNDKLSLRYVNESSEWRYIQNITSARCNDQCVERIYENSNSFVAEFQLACQEWKRTLVGLVHMLGYTVGVIIVGSLSDRYGRKTLAIVTGVTGAVCGLAKSFASFYWIYILLEFLEASLGDPYSPLYMLGLEMVATKSRVTYMTTCSLGLVIGGMSFPLIKWLIPYWRTCLRVMYAPGLLVFMLLIYLVDESPRWLLTKGKMNIAVKNIRNAAKLNKIEMEENFNMISNEPELNENFTIIAVIADTFKSRLLLKRFLVCVIWWNTCIFISHGLTVTSVLLEGNKYVNFALIFLMRLPSSIIAQYMLNKFNRKGPLISCFIACAVMCITHPFIPKNVLWLVITMFMASKVMTGLSFTTIYMFTSELFPTYSRNSMQALCSSLGRIGGIIATLMPFLHVYWTGLPIVLFGVMSSIAALATLLVPDTGKASLPDTVRQAEALGVPESRTAQRDGNGHRGLRKKRNNSN